MASIFAALTADAIATGKVNCYNFIVRLRSLPSLPRFVETISRGYCSAVQRPLACEDVLLIFVDTTGLKLGVDAFINPITSYLGVTEGSVDYAPFFKPLAAGKKRKKTRFQVVFFVTQMQRNIVYFII